MERRLGVELFERDRQGLRLTAAGEALLPSARAILERTEAAAEDARQAAGAGTLRVGYAVLAASELTTPILARLQSAEPRWRSACAWPTTTIPRPAWPRGRRTSRSSAARSPVFAFEDLFHEPRVAVLPRARAARPVRGIAELAHDAVIADPGPDAVWRAFYTADDVRGGRRRHAFDRSSFDEELATVSLGRAIAFTRRPPPGCTRGRSSRTCR